jgi:hypothetical protein
MKIFYNKQIGNYYATTDDLEQINCNGCNKLIEFDNIFILQRSFSKKQSQKYIWCNKCFKNHTKRVVDEFKIVKLSINMPVGSILIFNLPVYLSASREDSVFLAADRYESEVDIIDRRVHSNNLSWADSKIGEYPEDRIKELDTPFKTVGNCLNYLNNIAKSDMLIDMEEMPKLEINPRKYLDDPPQ